MKYKKIMNTILFYEILLGVFLLGSANLPNLLFDILFILFIIIGILSLFLILIDSMIEKEVNQNE